MPIGIDGQFYFSLDVAGTKDFLRTQDLKEFTLFEKVGNILPEYVLNFTSASPEILAYLNEGNKLKLTFGVDNENKREISLSTNGLTTSPETQASNVYATSGFASNLKYITDVGLQISDKKSGIEEVLSIASNHFTIDSNVIQSSDSQYWIQSKVSDKAHISKTYMHSDLSVSFPSIAITADDIFIFRDIKKLVDKDRPNGKKYDWRLTHMGEDKTDIVYDSSFKITSKSGFINNWVGYGRKLFINNLEGGTIDEIVDQPETLLSLSNEVDKDKNIGVRDGGTNFNNDNVHQTYQSSFNHNLMSLANVSKIELAVSVTGSYISVKPLDVIMFKKQDIQDENISDEFTSGLYIVTGVIRTIQHNTMSTTLLLNKEAFNAIKG